MKKLIYSIFAASSVAVSCAAIDYDKIYCYETNSCLPLKDTRVTAKVVEINYKTDENGFPLEILIQDKATNRQYVLMRTNDGKKTLKLEKVLEKRNEDCPYYLDCNWQNPVK